MATSLVRDRLREFFFMRQAISEADRIASSRGKAGVAQSRSARSLLAAAESLDDVSEWQLAAVILHREAAALAARALAARRQISSADSDLSSVWNLLTELVDVKAIVQDLSPEASKQVALVIAAGLAPEQYAWSPKELRALKESLTPIVRGMIRLLEVDILAPERLRGQVVVRWVVTGLAVLVLIGLVALKIRDSRLEVNLAAHAQVTTSSSFRPDVYNPMGLVDGDTSHIGCHTGNEVEPWALLDLGRSETVHRVVVTNRNDAGLSQLAVPLVVEVSRDGKKFEEFARRDADFKTWAATGNAVTARYVRLVTRRLSTLHLNEVEVY